MVVKEFEYVKGNTVRSPLKENEREKRKYEELKRSKKLREKRQFEQKKEIRKSLLQIAALIFVVGVAIISRDCRVYDMQKDISKLDTEIADVKDKNEALKVELLKVSSLSSIQENAEKKLGMTIATKENTIKIEIPKSYYDYVENADSNKNSKDK